MSGVFGILKKALGPVKPALRRRLGDDFPLWSAWLRTRLQSVESRRPIWRGYRVQWPYPGFASCLPFEVVGPGQDQVLIRVEVSAVSPGTEMAFFNQLPNTDTEYPYHPGYSCAGVVEAVGPGVSHVKRGDRVVAPLPHASMGLARASDTFLMPESVSFLAASLYQMAVISHHGVWLSRLQAGERVAVFGRGIIGQFAGQIAKAWGAAEVASVARSQSFINPALERCGPVLKPDQALEFGADIVFEATGDPRALTQAIASCREGGKVVLLGSSRGVTPDFDFGLLADRSISLIGAHTITMRLNPHADHDLPIVVKDVLAMMAGCEIDAEPLVDAHFDPFESGRLYTHLADGSMRYMSPVFDWDKLGSERLVKTSLRRKPTGIGRVSRAPEAVTTTGPDELPGARGTRAIPGVRIALVGCGAMGAAHAADIKASGVAELRWAVDTNLKLAEALAKAHGAQATSSLEDALIDHDLDAVFLCTPHFLHARQAIQAAKAGKHLIVEKPLATTVADAEAMVCEAKRNGVLLSTWLGKRYQPEIAEAARYAHDKAFGQLHGALVTCYIDKPASYYKTGAWRGEWEAAGGGVLITNGTHFIDWLLFLAREPVVEVSAAYAKFGAAYETEDNIAAWLKFASGAIATVSMCSVVHGSTGPGGEMKLWSSDTTIELGRENRIYSLAALPGLAPGRWHPLGGESEKPGVRFLRQFANALREGEPLEITGDDGLRTQEVIEAAYESARTGHKVKLVMHG